VLVSVAFATERLLGVRAAVVALSCDDCLPRYSPTKTQPSEVSWAC